MVTKDRPTGYCRTTRRCIAKYYSMGRTRGIVLKVLVDCSWNQSRNTWKYENVVPVVFGNLGALRILPGVERDGFGHSPHSISFPLISIRDQLIKTSIYHLLHTVCCSEARALRLGCWEHIILRITDLTQHVNSTPKAEQALPVCSGVGRSSRDTKPLLSSSGGARSCRILLRFPLLFC